MSELVECYGAFLHAGFSCDLCLLISLQMKVDGKNLLSVCKLAFKICRNKKNDFIIQNDTLLGMYSFLSVVRC